MIHKSLSIKEKVVVVNGGVGLIGRDVSTKLAEAEAIVYIGDINEKEGKGLANELKQKGLVAEYLPIDTTDEKSIREGIGHILEQQNKIDGWINCAYPRTGDWGKKELFEITVETWERNIQMHLGGYFLASREVLKIMKKQKSGSLINFGSIYGVLSPNFNIYKDTNVFPNPIYSAIKGGIVNLTKYLAGKFGKYGIRVNSVCPGGVVADQDSKFIERYNNLTPLRRMASPEDISPLIIFLVSDGSRYITGQTLMVDGGWSIW